MQHIAAVLLGIVFLTSCAKKPSPYENLGGDFVLSSIQGPVALSDFHGEVAVLFFGFLNCPDVCPSTLSTLSKALDLIAKEDRQKIQPLMIGLDHSRDTPAAMATYVRYFIPDMIGLSGSKPALKNITKRYGAYFAVVAAPDSNIGYTIAHTSKIYIIDGNGNISNMLDYTTAPTQLAAAIAAVIDSL